MSSDLAGTLGNSVLPDVSAAHMEAGAMTFSERLAAGKIQFSEV
jgi:hypothetical protein